MCPLFTHQPPALCFKNERSSSHTVIPSRYLTQTSYSVAVVAGERETALHVDSLSSGHQAGRFVCITSLNPCSRRQVNILLSKLLPEAEKTMKDTRKRVHSEGRPRDYFRSTCHLVLFFPLICHILTFSYCCLPGFSKKWNIYTWNVCSLFNYGVLMAILQEFNQGGNKSCISRFSHPLYSHCVCLLSVSTYSSYGLKWEDDPSPHSRSSAWRWETKQNIWTKEECLPVISQPSLPLLSWAVREWCLMKEGEKVKKPP